MDKVTHSTYEVTGSEVTRYYFAGASRIAMRKYTVPVSMSVEYFLTDHLGSTSITTDNTGAKVSEMRYTPWGEVRFPWVDPNLTTTPSYGLSDHTYTGQYSYTDDFGLMFYNARWYDPSLGRFAQADTIVPGGVQGYDRYAYVNNSPMNYVDPSGHFTCSNDRNSDDYCPGRGGGNSGGGSGPSGGGDNPLMGCGIHCSRDDINGASLEERYDWFSWLRGQMNEEIPGAGNWFNNIQTVMEGFINTGQHNNEWVLSVNVDILIDIQQGFASFTEGGSVPTTHGGEAWYEFFQMANAMRFSNDITNEDLLHQWGWAELLSTYDGMIESGAGLPSQGDDIVFTLFGTGYRATHFSLCYISNCLTDLRGVLSPLSTINSVLSSPGTSVYIAYGDRSPVAILFYGIYYGDLRQK